MGLSARILLLFMLGFGLTYWLPGRQQNAPGPGLAISAKFRKPLPAGAQFTRAPILGPKAAESPLLVRENFYRYTQSAEFLGFLTTHAQEAFTLLEKRFQSPYPVIPADDADHKDALRVEIVARLGILRAISQLDRSMGQSFSLAEKLLKEIAQNPKLSFAEHRAALKNISELGINLSPRERAQVLRVAGPALASIHEDDADLIWKAVGYAP